MDVISSSCAVYQVHPVAMGTKWTGLSSLCALCTRYTLLLRVPSGPAFCCLVLCVTSAPSCHGHKETGFSSSCSVYQVLPVATATKWTSSLPSCAASIRSTLETRRPAFHHPVPCTDSPSCPGCPVLGSGGESNRESCGGSEVSPSGPPLHQSAHSVHNWEER